MLHRDYTGSMLPYSLPTSSKKILLVARCILIASSGCPQLSFTGETSEILVSTA